MTERDEAPDPDEMVEALAEYRLKTTELRTLGEDSPKRRRVADRVAALEAEIRSWSHRSRWRR